MAENRDLGRGPPNITSSGNLEMVGLSTSPPPLVDDIIYGLLFSRQTAAARSQKEIFTVTAMQPRTGPTALSSITVNTTNHHQTFVFQTSIVWDEFY